MTNEELELRFSRLVKTERKITLEVLRLVGEAERRRHFLERGFSSVYDWLTRGHGYSHPAANRRVQSARMLCKLPELEADITSGALNLSVLSRAYSTFRGEERRTGKEISATVKLDLVKTMREKSFEECERILREAYPVAAKKEVLRSVDGERSRLFVTLGKNELETLQRARNLLSHSVPNGSWSGVIAYLANDYVKRRDRKKSESASPRVNPTNSPSCEFRDPESGRVCGSRYQLQEDHIIPRALGGSDERENLRLLCRQHNLYEAERLLGKAAIAPFRKH